MSSLPYYICYIIPASLFLGLYLGSWGIALPSLLGYVLLPCLDLVFKFEKGQLSPEQEAVIKDKWSFRLVTLLWAPVQVAVTLVGVWYAATQNLSWWEFVLLVHATSVSNGGIGITISHELCHRKTKLEQWASQIILSTVNYMHFHIEHVVGHHQRVATPEDPATARLGESYYAFWLRSVVGSFRSAWEFENKRVRLRKQSAWKLQNKMVNYLLVQSMISIAITVIFGPIGLTYHIAQSILSFSTLENINYVEHYGLVRKKLENGRYEKVLPIHSWNSNHLVSNLFLFKLQRHSDHHANANRRYQVLRNFPEAPQLPVSYPTMVLLSYIPPLYKKVMTPLLEEHKLIQEQRSSVT